MAEQQTSSIKHRKKSKVQTVAEDIEVQIQNGLLRHGERIAAYSVLSDHYSVSEGVVTQAIATLAEKGLVKTKRRSGTFVHNSQAEDDVPADVSAFFEPRPTRVKQLTFYATDLRSDFWEDMIDAFCKENPDIQVDLLMCTDGHVDDLIEDRNVDVVMSTPAVLSHLNETFIGPSDLCLVNMDESEYVDPVRRYLKLHGSELGVPFSLTLQFLFVNRDLSDDLHVDLASMETMDDFLSEVKRVEMQLTEEGSDIHALNFGTSLFDFFVLSGAVAYDGERLEFRKRRALRVAEQLVDTGSKVINPQHVPDLFQDDEVVFMHHCSYTVRDMLMANHVRFSALPSVIAEDASMVARIMLLALNRKTQFPQECLKLISFLNSHEIQLKYARQFGNIPARESAALDKGYVADHPLGRDVLSRTLDFSTVMREETLNQINNTMSMHELLKEDIIVSDYIARIAFALQLAFGDALSVVE